MKIRLWSGLAVVLCAAAAARAEAEAVRLSERFPEGYQYRVRTRVEVSGTLTPPPVKGKVGKPVQVDGTSAVEYEERVLHVDRGSVSKTVRLVEKLDFRRTLAGQPQQLSLRHAVRRLVILRRGHTEVPFSPDGPLTWGEIDAVRTDVFVPALAGLLPERAVRVGDRWPAAATAVQELTDLEKIEEGGLECRLERLQSEGRRRLARVTFAGTVRGVGEDGPVRHRLQGYYLFDLSGHLAELTLNGTTSLLDRDGKEVGRVDGRFALAREPGGKAGGLSAASLRGVKLDPDADNTLLLYDNPDLGVRFLHPRRWKVAQVSGPQVALDAGDGSGVLITVDPLDRVPAAAAFQRESQQWLVQKKAKVVRSYSPARRRAAPPLDTFAVEAELGGQKFWMDYYVTTQSDGGATLAARLQPADLVNLRREVEKIARSVVITKRIVGK